MEVNIKRVRPAQNQKPLSTVDKALREKYTEKSRLKREKKIAEEKARREARQALFKPCPFCGCNLVEVPYPGDLTVFVQCVQCNATGGVGKTEEEAINNWNKRVGRVLV